MAMNDLKFLCVTSAQAVSLLVGAPYLTQLGSEEGIAEGPLPSAHFSGEKVPGRQLQPERAEM